LCERRARKTVKIGAREEEVKRKNRTDKPLNMTSIFDNKGNEWINAGEGDRLQ
jgi:hypothetical protein